MVNSYSTARSQSSQVVVSRSVVISQPWVSLPLKKKNGTSGMSEVPNSLRTEGIDVQPTQTPLTRYKAKGGGSSRGDEFFSIEETHSPQDFSPSSRILFGPQNPLIVPSSKAVSPLVPARNGGKMLDQ